MGNTKLRRIVSILGVVTSVESHVKDCKNQLSEKDAELLNNIFEEVKTYWEK